VKPRPTILIVDGELAIRRLLRNVLVSQNYRVFEAMDARAGLEQAACRRPDVIILETILDDMDGLDFLRALREWNHKPVLVLSAQTKEAEKVAALDAGANDYMTKPFGSEELFARLRVLQRSLPGVPDGPFLLEGDLRVNLTAHDTTFKGCQLRLSPTEEALFYLLARYAGKVVTFRHMLRCVWGTDAESKMQDLRVYVAQLRKKLREYGGEIQIRTQGTFGYCLSFADGPHAASLAATQGSSQAGRGAAGRVGGTPESEQVNA
jgi:two-component system KDP operon response regulator KdpE